MMSMIQNVYSLKPYLNGLSAFLVMLICTITSFSQAPVAIEDEVFTDDNVSANGDLSDNDLNPSGLTLTYTLLQSTYLGNLTLATNGNWTFVPYQLVGIDTIYYTVCNTLGQCDTGMIGVYVRFVNNPPEPEDDFLLVEMDEPRFGSVGDNDFDSDYLTDPLGSTNIYTVFIDPLHGSLLFNLDGTFEYTPDQGYVGADQFAYYMCDPCSVCSPATVYIDVIGSNFEPVANDSYGNSLNEDTSFSGTASDFASDPEMDPLTFQVISQPLHGFITMTSSGSFIYQPLPNYFGEDSVMYLVCDIIGQCAVATIGFVVNPVNDAPNGGSEVLYTNEDIPSFSGDVSTNDTDDGGPLTFSVVVGSTHGTISMQSDGAFIYVPDTNFYGLDIIIYNVCDSEMLCDQDTLTLVISSLNDWPVVTSYEQFGYEDFPTTGGITIDSYDVDGDILTYSLLSSPIGGNIVLNPAGTYVYTPNPNYSGFEIIYFQACDPFNACASSYIQLEIIEINDEPIVFDDFLELNEDEVGFGNLLTNDIEPDGEEMIYWTVNNPMHGILELNLDGTFSYTPDANWFGTEEISYFGCDPCSVCDGGILTLQVDPQNDLPSVVDANVVLLEDATKAGDLNLLAEDLEDSSLLFAVIANPAHGSFTISANGNYLYTPQSNYFGADSVNFSVCDNQGGCAEATLSFTVESVNDIPQAIDDNDSVNEDDELSGTVANDNDVEDVSLNYSIITPPMFGSLVMMGNGTFEYAPDSNFSGVDMATYSVCDDEGACDAAVIIIEVNPVNDAPDIFSENNVTYANDMLTGSVSSNDTDIDGDALSYSLLNGPSNGTFFIASNGNYTYEPVADYFGLDQITYQACDPSGLCGTGILDITIFSVNTAPIATNDVFATVEDQSLTQYVGSNDSDDQGGVMSYSLVADVASGMLVLNPTGIFTYTPSNNYSGAVSFIYQICDSGNLCDVATVSISVTAVNDTPIAVSEAAVVDEDGLLLGAVNANDFDADGDALFYTVISTTAAMNFSMASDGSYSFSPADNFYGAFEVEYNVCDSQGACSAASIVFSVMEVNDAPSAVADNNTCIEDDSVAGNILLNDFDIENDPLILTVTNGAEHGEFLLSANGDYLYTPYDNYFGNDTVGYTICDDGGLCSTAVLVIAITGLPDFPSVIGEEISLIEESTASGDLSINDNDVDGDNLNYSLLMSALHGELNLTANGTFSYTPVLNFWGNDSALYMACDPLGNCKNAWIIFEVDFLNDLPIIVDEIIAMQAGDTLSGNVGINDIEYDFETIIYQATDQIVDGEFSMDINGNFTFIPSEGVSGTFVFVYTGCDPCSMCDQATLTIVVEAEGEINTAPQAENISLSSCQGELLHISMDEFVFDMQSEDFNLSYTFSQPNSGIINYDNETHELLYQPFSNFIGNISFTYQVCDNSAFMMCSNGNIVVNVNATTSATVDNYMVNPVGCYGELNGSIELDATGEGNLSYAWSNGSDSEDLYNLSVNNYVLTITSDAACTEPAQFLFTVNGPSNPLTGEVVSLSDITQAGNGFIHIDISGGTPPYDVLWLGPQEFFSTDEDLENLSVGGNYSAVITDAHLCFIEISTGITGQSEIEISNQFAVLPNPFTDKFVIQANGKIADFSYNIFDATGRIVVESQKVNGNMENLSVDMSAYPSGIYHLCITSAESVATTFKLVKQ